MNKIHGVYISQWGKKWVSALALSLSRHHCSLKPLSLQIRQKRNVIFPAASYVRPLRNANSSVIAQKVCVGMCRRLAVLRVTVWVGLQMDTGEAKSCWRVFCGPQLSRKAWLTLKWKCCLLCKRSCPFFLGRRVNTPWAARASIREWGVDIFHFHQWSFPRGPKTF